MRQRNLKVSMGRRPLSRLVGLGLLISLGLVGGCDLGIDPDSLVRELRVLGMRVATGDPAAAATVADLQAQVVLGAGGIDIAFTTESVTLSALVVEPTGTGRRVAAPRTLQYDWFLCVGLKSLYSPGSLDPACRKWGPTDPDPKTNAALFYLNGAGTMAAGSPTLTLPTAVLKGVLVPFFQTAQAGGQNSGGGTADMAGGSGLPTRAQTILLPVLLRTSVVGGDPTDNRNSEVGYNYLRVIIAVPLLGIPLPPANHNPVLNPALIGPQSGAATEPLLPCPADGTSCAPFTLPRSASAFINGQVADGSIETYTPLDDSERMGIAETLRFSWFSTDGEFSELRTGTAKPETKWTSGEKYAAPDEVTTVPLWLVVQDERGGTDWHQYHLQLQ